MAIEHVRFLLHGRPSWGRHSQGKLEVLSAAPWADPKPTGESVESNGVEWLAPAEPTKIICVGLNYKDHAAEMGHGLPEEPLIFMKPASALLDPGKSIRIPRSSQRVDYEAELAFVIGKKVGPGVDDEDAIFGYTCANDVTARDLQKKMANGPAPRASTPSAPWAPAFGAASMSPTWPSAAASTARPSRAHGPASSSSPRTRS